MLDDELLLKAAEGVDYSSLPSMPTPEDFYLLSRVKGQTSVAQLCAASGWGKDKARTTIEKLIEFGLLIADGAGGEAKSTKPAGGGPGATDPENVKAKTTAATQEAPAVGAETRERLETPQQQAAVSHDEPGGRPSQEPSRDHVRTPVRDSPKSSFDLPVVEDDEDDLFMSDSPAHISKIKRSSQASRSDASSTRPFDEGEDLISTLEAETNPGDDSEDTSEHPPESDSASRSGAHLVNEHPDAHHASSAAIESSVAEDDDPFEDLEPTPAQDFSEPGFAILDSEVAEEEKKITEDATTMLDPTSLDIATSVASVDGEKVDTNRGGAAVDGPLAFAMLPGKLTEFTLAPELLDPKLEIDARARQEVAYVHTHLDRVNHYQLFGVSQEASRKEIKKAYFVLSKRFHPDLYFRKETGPFGDMVEDVFKAVTQAYSVLSHRKKRAQYDEELKVQATEPTPEQRAADSKNDELEKKKELARELLLKRASTHEMKGEFVRAADSYRKALAIRGEAAILVKLANALYRANKRLGDAANYCRSALREEPENLDGLLTLAKILERNDMYDDALDALAQAKRIAPDEPSIAVHEDRIRSLIEEG